MKYVAGCAVLIVILTIIYAVITGAGLNLLSVPIDFHSGRDTNVRTETGGKIITESSNQDEELPQSQ